MPKGARYDQTIFTSRNWASKPCYSSQRCDLERNRPNKSLLDGPGVTIKSGCPVTTPKSKSDLSCIPSGTASRSRLGEGFGRKQTPLLAGLTSSQRGPDIQDERYQNVTKLLPTTRVDVTKMLPKCYQRTLLTCTAEFYNTLVTATTDVGNILVTFW